MASYYLIFVNPDGSKREQIISQEHAQTLKRRSGIIAQVKPDTPQPQGIDEYLGV